MKEHHVRLVAVGGAEQPVVLRVARDGLEIVSPEGRVR
jgi:hypothetical protein